ncbi:MAG: paaF [Frankiales bacterium]|nr:paaF [Frankiales bacterium]
MTDIETKKHDGWVEFALDRPQKRNALSQALMAELETCLLEADRDPDVHAMLISANGIDFSAGFDLHDIRVESVNEDDPAATVARITRGRRVMRLIPDLQKPVVAKVHGRCLAGGTELVFMCDIVYAADDARFGYPPVRDMGTPAVPMWLFHVGPQWAKRLLFTGDSITAADAAKIGLILKALPADELDAEVTGFMKRLTKIDWQLLAAQKRIVNTGLELAGMKELHKTAAMLDTMALQSPTAKKIRQTPSDELIPFYKSRREELFGDGSLSVDGPDGFDSEGRLV